MRSLNVRMPLVEEVTSTIGTDASGAAALPNNVGGIFIAPTIAVNKSEVRRGDTITVFGQSVSDAEVTISIHSEQEIFGTVRTDADGAYLYQFDTSELEYGSHAAKSKTALSGQITPYSKTVAFAVGNKNVDAEVDAKCESKADLNKDCEVNLVDFSIMAYWYKRTLTTQAAYIDLNGDRKIDIVDFSILAYNWTG